MFPTKEKLGGPFILGISFPASLGVVLVLLGTNLIATLFTNKTISEIFDTFVDMSAPGEGKSKVKSHRHVVASRRVSIKSPPNE